MTLVGKLPVECFFVVVFLFVCLFLALVKRLPGTVKNNSKAVKFVLVYMNINVSMNTINTII